MTGWEEDVVSEFTPAVLFGGMFASPLLAVLFKRSLTADGAVLLGAIFAVTAFSAGTLMSFGACYQFSCSSSSTNTFILLSGTAGILEVGWLTFALYGTKRGRARRAILVGAAVLSMATFAAAIFSFGVLLIIGAWALLGWLAIKDPPLRESELPPTG